ncbi:MAG: Holliday junction branch migration DNA helicase RuvB [Candidatus Pacebacteria bacterium]|nr:Holliday junction branch migration DNA helicase RuvB [Candidatus Paceibacterota bacterium]
MSTEKSNPIIDPQLRPNTWDEYIGQQKIKDNLHILLTAAKKRGDQPEHILFYGPPGLGKTTISHLIAKESGRNIKITSGPAIEKVGDLASILTNLANGDILFIDEIHRLNNNIEEILYPAMESGVLDIIIGKGPSARTIQLDLPPFTLIAATTKIAMMSSPLRSRFSGGVFKLEFYTENEIAQIIKQSAQKLNITILDETVDEIAKRARYTPRTANYFLKRCRDYAEVHETDLDKNSVLQSLDLIGVDEEGLQQIDRDVLLTIIEKFNGGPVGLKTIATATHEEIDSIESVVEPYLIQKGFLELTPRGRTATVAAYEHLGKEFIKNNR